MDRYKNAKIYKIVDNTNGNVYIGSTCKRLCQRIAQHRESYKRYLDGKHSFVTSFKILENSDYNIILIEEVQDCTGIEHLRARERYYIENNKCVNRYIPGRTMQEYRKNNSEKIKEQNKEYIKNNKERIKKYRENNKERIKKQTKEYRELNKERIKEYREKNKEKIKEQRYKKCNCECGGKYTHNNRTMHFKTKKHIKFTENGNN